MRQSPPSVGFLPPLSPRVLALSYMRAILGLEVAVEEMLGVKDRLVKVFFRERDSFLFPPPCPFFLLSA